MQFGDFEAKIEAVIFVGFEQDLGDVGNGYGLAAAFGDNLFGSFEKLGSASEMRRHAPELAANPAAWMPWNYQQQVA